MMCVRVRVRACICAGAGRVRERREGEIFCIRHNICNNTLSLLAQRVLCRTMHAHALVVPMYMCTSYTPAHAPVHLCLWPLAAALISEQLRTTPRAI